MNDLPHIAGRIFNRPLLIEPMALDAMLAPLRARLGVHGAAPAVQLAIAPRMLEPEDEAAAAERGRRRPYAVTAEGVAVVQVLGVLVARAGQITPDCTELRSYQAIERDMARALTDPEVRAIVLDIDSPGGEAANVLELSARIRTMRGGKPIVAAVNASAYSAAYALASAADRIMLPPSGGVGSIGVVSLHVDRSGEDAAKGHRYTWIAAGARKLDGNPHAPLTDEAAAVIEAEVRRLYGMFTEAVASNRRAAGLTPAKVAATEAGVFFGDNALKAGLADEIGSLQDAIRLAAQAAFQTGRGRPSTRSQHAGGKMADDDKAERSAETTTTAAAPPPDLAALRAEARAAEQERAKEIAALCELAGVPQKAASFIAEGLSGAEVRAALLAARAAAGGQGGEISAYRRADAGVIGQQPGPSGASAVAIDAAWNRVGATMFGAAWKEI